MDYKEFFVFTKQERRGISVFLLLSFVIITLFSYWPVNQPENEIDLSQYYQTEDSTDTSYSDSENESSYDLWDTEAPSKQKVRLTFAFNPNEISYDSLLLLGFSHYGAKSLTNFVAKGGKIKNMEKLKSIYGLDTMLVNELSDYITFTEENENALYAKTEYLKKTFEEPKQEIVELNSADSIQLISIRGIGPYTASKIINTRNKLGGYLSLDQLLECKVLSDSAFQLLAPYFDINPGLIKKININAADFKILVTHPYIDQATASAILKYRKQHGSFSDARHISRIKAISEETGTKILPYLAAE